jgi:Fe-S-cluster containining protein
MKSKAHPSITANWRSESRIAQQLQHATVDHEALTAPLSPCTSCAGVCCSHGFYPEADELLDLEDILKEKEEALIQLGVKKPSSWFVDEDHPDFGSVKRVALNTRSFHSSVGHYPKHFPNTACVFLLENARCALQVLAMEEGKHKWSYKPILCALFPLVIDEQDSGDIAVTVYDPKRSATPRPEYDGFNAETPCGTIHTYGTSGTKPASDVLQEEIAFLHQIQERSDS